MSTASIVRVEQYTLVDTLRARAQRQPHERAYTYLNDGEQEEVVLSYAALDHKARAIAAHLQKIGTDGARILLLYPQGLEYISAFFGCLYAGRIPVPLYLPAANQLKRSMLRFRSVVESAQPAAVLTTTTTLSAVTEVMHSYEPHAIRCLSTDDLSLQEAIHWREPDINLDTLALLQYTSGSTAQPKGVMVTHGNLIHNFRLMRDAAGYPERSTYVSWLPLFHDMGLIGNVLQTLYWGYSCILLSPVAFLQRPYRWLRAISHYHAHTSGAPNFAYDLCVQKITPEQRATLDLRSWTQAFNGSEPIRSGTLERFSHAFAESGFQKKAFLPLYGLAEATLFVAFGSIAKEPKVLSVQGNALRENRAVVAPYNSDNPTFVGCGNTTLDQKVIIVDPDSRRRCAPDEIGEIWITGPSVAQGYWNLEEETQRTFKASLAEDDDQKMYLRTGDLGFLHNHELFVTGRLKDLIIIDGRNHYPQDIELSVEQSHEAFHATNSAAFSLDLAGREQLVVVAEVNRHYEPNSDLSSERTTSGIRIQIAAETLVKAIRQAVAHYHDLQVRRVILIKPGTIPKTSSGKIQRHMCRAKLLEGTLAMWGGSNEHSRVSEK